MKLMERLLRRDDHHEGGVESIDLRSGDVVELEPEPTTLRFGLPSRCPRCAGSSYLDHVDVGRRVQHEHCLECGHQWALSEAELLAGR